MATVIAHGLAASLLSTAGPKSVPRTRLALVLAALAILPDADVVGFSYGIAYSDMLGHRGFTHSVLFAAIAGLIAPKLAFPSVQAFTRAWLLLATLCFLATLSHGIMDAFTDAGLGVGFLIPFDGTRYFAPWRPIATSPLGISAFFDGTGLSILSNELLWIGVPLASTVGIIKLVRQVRRRGDA